MLEKCKQSIKHFV